MQETLNILDQPLNPEQRLWFRSALKECIQFSHHQEIMEGSNCFNCQQ